MEQSARPDVPQLWSCLVPRPFAWLTASDGKGRLVACPTSSIMPLPGDTPMLAIGFDAPGGITGTVFRNLSQHADFVVHVIPESLLAEAVETVESPSDAHDPNAPLGLLTVAMNGVAASRLVDLEVALGCRVRETHALPGSFLLVADVLSWARPDRLLDRRGLLDVHKLRPVGALGGHMYCPVREVSRVPPVHLRPEDVPKAGF